MVRKRSGREALRVPSGDTEARHRVREPGDRTALGIRLAGEAERVLGLVQDEKEAWPSTNSAWGSSDAGCVTRSDA